MNRLHPVRLLPCSIAVWALLLSCTTVEPSFESQLPKPVEDQAQIDEEAALALPEPLAEVSERAGRPERSEAPSLDIELHDPALPAIPSEPVPADVPPPAELPSQQELPRPESPPATTPKPDPTREPERSPEPSPAPPPTPRTSPEREPADEQIPARPVERVVVPEQQEPEAVVSNEGTTSDPDPVHTVVSPLVNELIVRLPGSGWLFVGSEQGGERVRLRRKRTVGTNTEFVFEVESAGEYDLWFQRQDASSGAFDTQSVTVQAEEGDRRAGSATAPQTSAAATGTDSPADRRQEAEMGSSDVSTDSDAVLLRPAIELLEAGDEEGAFRLFIDLTSTLSDGLESVPVDTLSLFADAAETSEQLPYLTARRFWAGLADAHADADAEGELAARARRRLLELSMENEDIDGLVDASNSMIASGEVEPAQLLDIARRVGRSGDQERAGELAEAALGPEASPASYSSVLDDEGIFLRAKRLEALGPGRDLRKALAFYEEIVSNYPLSAYWEESRSRAEHLRRHYFDVR